jgi:putative component of membrane protein insertase Oxa1/YidC/SpoIIIJ protein YidD
MRWSTRAPAFAAGAFVVFVRAAAGADATDLARQLMDDGCWAECRRECERVLAADPGNAGAAALRVESERHRAPAAGAEPRATAGSIPGRALVRFYRAAIRPAIGARCSLEPSCSEYFLLVSRRHGVLGFPMMVDRLVREPSLVGAHPVPAPPGGAVRVPDPVYDHDFWMRPRPAAPRPDRRALP